MIWQDYVVAAAMFAFVYSLVPQIMKGFKAKKDLVSLQTSSIYGIASLVLAVSFATLELTFTAIMNFIVAALWGVIFFQTVMHK